MPKGHARSDTERHQQTQGSTSRTTKKKRGHKRRRPTSPTEVPGTRKAPTNGTTLKGTPEDKGTKQRRRTPEDAGIDILNYDLKLTCKINNVNMDEKQPPGWESKGPGLAIVDGPARGGDERYVEQDYEDLTEDQDNDQRKHESYEEDRPRGKTAPAKTSKRKRTTSPSEEVGGGQTRRISSPAARVYDPGAARRRSRSCEASSAQPSSGRHTRAFGAAARTGRLSLKKRGRGAPAASE